MAMTFKTFDEILADMKTAVSDLDTSEGSFVDTVLRAAAMEIAQAYFDQEALLPIAFVDETSGSYIDLRAAEYGIERKVGTKAAASVTFAGSDGTVVAAGTAVQTADGLIFTTDADATVAGGAATAAVTAAETGVAYNVAAGKITTMTNSALVTISGSAAASGGTDDETDAALLARLYALWRKPATSGNANQYEAWALEVDGIGGAKIIPRWNGPGTVKVIVVDSEMQPPTAAQVTAVASHVEKVREICVDVTVEAAAELPIAVSASITTDSTTTKGDVRISFAALLGDYCRSLAFESNTVVYNRIAYMLLSIDGVTDFSALTINGGTANLTLADNAVPVAGEVTIT